MSRASTLDPLKNSRSAARETAPLLQEHQAAEGMSPSAHNRAAGFDEEFSVGGDARPLIPEGQYVAACTDAEIVELFKFGRSRKLFLHFEVNEGMHKGTSLFLPMTAPEKTGKVGVGSKLYASYLIANGGRPPGRRDRLAIKVFKHRLFRVRVRTVRPRFENGTPKPARFHYSVIAELLERLA